MYIIYINNVKNWDVYGKKKRERKQHEYETIWWMNGTDLICKETKESYEKSFPSFFVSSSLMLVGKV